MTTLSNSPRAENNNLHSSGGQTSGVAFAAAAALAFGTLAIFAKFGYEHGATPLPLLATRFSLATVVLAGFSLVTGRSLKLPRSRAVRLLALGGLGYGLESTLFFAALERAPASLVGLIFYSYPIWTNLIGLVTGMERFRRSTIAALVVGSAGVALIFTIPKIDPGGAGFALAAAVAVSIYFTLAQIFQRGVEPAVAATYTAGGAALATGAGSALTGQTLPVGAIPSAIGLALATVVAFVLMFAAIARIGSARTSIAAMLEPVTTIVLAAVFLNEQIGPRLIAGTVLIVATLPILMTAEVRGARTARPADTL